MTDDEENRIFIPFGEYVLALQSFREHTGYDFPGKDVMDNYRVVY